MGKSESGRSKKSARFCSFTRLSREVRRSVLALVRSAALLCPLALALTAVLVLPSLDDSLVSNRVDTVARSARQSAATFQTNFENALQGPIKFQPTF